MKITTVEISQDHSNENEQRLFIQSLLEQGNHTSSLVFGRGSEADRKVGKVCSGKKGRLCICPNWKL